MVHSARTVSAIAAALAAIGGTEQAGSAIEPLRWDTPTRLLSSNQEQMFLLR